MPYQGSFQGCRGRFSSLMKVICVMKPIEVSNPRSHNVSVLSLGRLNYYATSPKVVDRVFLELVGTQLHDLSPRLR